MLSDNVLLEIFDFYRSFYLYLGIWKWHVLVHVCQRWRQVVFASPHRLHLRILYNYGTPVRNLAIWPAFPIVISPHPYSWSSLTPKDEGNLIATLKHVDRLWSVTLVVTGPQLKKMARMVQAQFPVLTRLGISLKDGKAPPLPRRFLGGSAPRLQKIHLDGILYPALPTLLLSTSDLVSLKLCRVPPAGYISPEVMVASLAALPRLTSLLIDFKLITPHQMHPPPVTRTVLPALTNFRFEGASEYLEDLVARIDSPQLLRIDVFYSDGFVDNRIAPLLAPLAEFVHRLVHRYTGSELTTFGRVDISLWSGQVDFALRQADQHYPDWDRRPGIDISCRANIWQLSHIAQVLSQFSATRSTVVHLALGVPIRVIFESDAEMFEAHRLDRTDGSEWLLLQQFPAMRTLHVSRWLSKHVALALERTGEMAAELLPFLDLICLEDQPASSIEKFVTARQLSDRPVIVTDRYTEYADRLKSYVSK